MTQIFYQEFRDNAVKVALERKIPIKQLAADLGVGKSTLTRWITVYRKGGRTTSGESPEQKEIRRLKRSLEIVTMVGFLIIIINTHLLLAGNDY